MKLRVWMLWLILLKHIYLLPKSSSVLQFSHLLSFLSGVTVLYHPASLSGPATFTSNSKQFLPISSIHFHSSPPSSDTTSPTSVLYFYLAVSILVLPYYFDSFLFHLVLSYICFKYFISNAEILTRSVCKNSQGSASYSIVYT